MWDLLDDLLGSRADLTAVTHGLQAAAPWLAAGAGLAVIGGGAVWGWWRRRAHLALQNRTAVELVPTSAFNPSVPAVERHAAHLARVPATAGWLPRRAGAVRVRALCADQELVYRLEGPARAAALLRLPTYTHVDVQDADDGVRAHHGDRIHFEGAPPLPRPAPGTPDGETTEQEQDRSL